MSQCIVFFWFSQNNGSSDNTPKEECFARCSLVHVGLITPFLLPQSTVPTYLL